MFSSDQPDHSVCSRAGSHNDDNSVPGQGTHYALESSDSTTAPDAPAIDKGDLVWKDHELSACCPHYSRVLTATHGDPNLEDRLLVDVEREPSKTIVPLSKDRSAGDHWQRQDDEATRDCDGVFQLDSGCLSGRT